ncbi:MAG: hypothetical protein CGW95_01230 [Phenylobacterium zucineum]|nr:MAG: hypothetical protein CGW95_01230 [Phenylobacterium zucineum]
MEDPNNIEPPFKVGDHVRKKSGYLWPGVVVAIFLTTEGKVRLVVECTAPDVKGALHIYALDQIEKGY